MSRPGPPAAGVTVGPPCGREAERRSGEGTGMRLTADQIEILAHEIVRRMDDRGMARFPDRSGATDRVIRLLTDDLQVEDRLNDEVREILDGLSAQMQRQNVQYHEMFKLVKTKLVRERKLIL